MVITDISNGFCQFFLSVNGVLGKGDLVVLANLIQLVAAKMDEPILHVQCWINGWISIIFQSCDTP